MAWDMDGDKLHPRAFAEEEEIKLLIEALKMDMKGDSWEIADMD